MGQIPLLETNWRSLNPKLPYSITPALSGPGRSGMGNQSLALSVVSFICAARMAALRSARARSVACFASLGLVRRESQFLNSLNSCNSLNSFSSHVDR
jgi:hypothetical protein